MALDRQVIFQVVDMLGDPPTTASKAVPRSHVYEKMLLCVEELFERDVTRDTGSRGGGPQLAMTHDADVTFQSTPLHWMVNCWS